MCFMFGNWGVSMIFRNVPPDASHATPCALRQRRGPFLSLNSVPSRLPASAMVHIKCPDTVPVPKVHINCADFVERSVFALPGTDDKVAYLVGRAILRLGLV